MITVALKHRKQVIKKTHRGSFLVVPELGESKVQIIRDIACVNGANVQLTIVKLPIVVVLRRFELSMGSIELLRRNCGKELELLPIRLRSLEALSSDECMCRVVDLEFECLSLVVNSGKSAGVELYLHLFSSLAITALHKGAV